MFLPTTERIDGVNTVSDRHLQCYIYTLRRKSELLWYGDLKGFLDLFPLLKSPTFKPSKHLSIISMNLAVSTVSLPPTSLRAEATLLLSTCAKIKLQ